MVLVQFKSLKLNLHGYSKQLLHMMIVLLDTWCTWVDTINNITKMLCAEIGIVDNEVFMGKVNNRSKIYMFTIFYISQANLVCIGIVSFHYNCDTTLVKASG